MSKQNYPTINSRTLVYKGGYEFMEELSYSLHLSNDKNKTKRARQFARNNELMLLLLTIMQYKIINNYQKLINII